MDEGIAPQDAMDECDELFELAFADRGECDSYYADHDSVPAEEATAHCEALFPA